MGFRIRMACKSAFDTDSYIADESLNLSCLICRMGAMIPVFQGLRMYSCSGEVPTANLHLQEVAVQCPRVTTIRKTPDNPSVFIGSGIQVHWHRAA